MLNLQLIATGTGTLKRKAADPTSPTVGELVTLRPDPSRMRVAGVLTPVKAMVEVRSIKYVPSAV